MISAVFVDRPRLAIVIAILMTLAGVLSLLRIPVAQFPDIVPPQVTISTSYAGASAAVVEATVAQPLEAQIVGVDKMIYMKSNSGNDGSYCADRQLRAGHQSRHRHGQRQQPRAAGAVQAAARGAALRPHRAQAFRRDPGVPAVLQRGRQAGPAVHQQLRHHQRARPAGAHAGRRRCAAVRTAGLLDAYLVRHEPADQPESRAVRHHRRDPAAECAGAGGPHRRAADQRCDAVPAQRADAGTPDHAGAVRPHRDPRQSRRFGAAAVATSRASSLVRRTWTPRAG